jgi:hypothetical protein
VAAGHQIRESDGIKIGGACSKYGEGINVYGVLVGIMRLGNPECKGEDDFKILKAKSVHRS